MHLPSITPHRGATITLPETPRATRATFHIGQRIQALVIARNNDGGVQLNVNGQHVEAKTDLALIPGQRLRLMVEQTANRLVLRLLEAPRGSEVLAKGLRTALPRQEPLTRLTQTLVQMTREGADRTLPEPARALIQRLTANLPSPDRVATPDRLRAAVADSGLFMESKLVQGRTEQLGSDLKATLSRLAALLRAGNQGAARTPSDTGGRPATPPGARPPTPFATPVPRVPLAPLARPPAQAVPTGPMRPVIQPPQPPSTGEAARPAPPLPDSGAELLRHVESALARLQLHQLTTLPSQDTNDPNWVIEIPLHAGEEDEGLRLRVRRDGARDDDGEGGPRWSVTLDYDTAAYGAIHMVVSLKADRVSARFWSERSETAGLFHDHLELLEARLRAAGLQVDQVSSRTGIPRRDAGLPDVSGLLDVTA